MEQARRGIPSYQTRHDNALDLLHASEAAALAAARLLGRGDQDRVREAAGEAMRAALEGCELAGTVILGPRNDAYLPKGLELGGGDRRLQFGVYPVEGASLVAKGTTGAISLVVAVEVDGFAALPPVWYAEKIVAGPAARGAIDLDDPIADNLRRIAFARDARVQDLTVAILDRPRHQDLMSEIAAAGARMVALEEGDIAGAVMAAVAGTSIDAFVGIGGIEEAVIAACAVRCLGGEFQARMWSRNEEERILLGEDGARAYGALDLAPSVSIQMAITGVSGGQLLPGVGFGSGYAETSSLLMSSRHATVRTMTTRHHQVGDPG